MRIDCLYFPTSSVGGIATNTAALRAEANRRGDTFHVLVSANASTHVPTLYTEPTLIRGGDTFINIDGYAPHSLAQAQATAEWLNESYDLVYLAFLCPHPTKAYGTDPVFLGLLRALKRPIIGRISDGYYDSYYEWGEATMALCSRLVVAMEPYLPEGLTERFPNLPIIYGRPFDPVELPENRSPKRHTAYISQWKAIKGIHRLLPLLPQVEGTIDLYSNGILYYQLRWEPEWQAAVGQDLFKPEHSGKGKATFYGWQPMSVIREALTRAWFMPEGQGLGRPKNAAYRKGATNNTTMEALYYGCTPVIPQTVIDNAGIPPEAAIGVADYDDFVPALNGPRAPRPDLGKQWVLDNFHVSRVYDRFFK